MATADQHPPIRRALAAALVATALVTLLAADGGRGRVGAAGPAAQDPSVPQALRDVRYCEVIPVTLSGSTATAWIYNTLGFNSCPPELWTVLTEAQVNQAYGSVAAKLNGPRYWVLDQIQATGGETSTGISFVFGGIEMGLRGTIDTPVGQPTVGEQFYVPNEVQRDTIWTYLAGRPIFLLTSPEGEVYVMQSYSQIADPTLTYAQLPQLASRLSLPPGWSYSMQTLTEDLHLASQGLAYVVNDNLYNSYQRRMDGGGKPPPVPKSK
jgi:hypothetical protein